MVAVSSALNAILVEELQRRAPQRGMRKRLAHDLGTDQTRLSRWFKGQSHIPEHIAWRLLAKVRDEELELAAKIEAELLRPSMLKEGE